MQEDGNVNPALLIAVRHTVPTPSTFFVKCKSNENACDSSAVAPAGGGGWSSKNGGEEVLHPRRMHPQDCV
ncbi:hypothetical protein BU25DRAFT_405759 [Macroventuria anomochaeta]|uniref:Uncharacterized protein n=1 Tax=Macroventuria anomochaeta TaxID=301207 RepID=A0ACB6SIM9_9PLEO|nr:uncharacterized protein BU25DRAFT_405759 [Macroventuria anomochaeta]KAF2633934.1 hypothetical protein BU25DRAFT_405759 [Macroventuria anomochaeta]